MTIRIVIAEDQRMLRGALGTLLDFEGDFEVVGQAKDGEEALRLVKELKPDICIMDIEMPVKSGLDVAAELQRQQLTCRVIILTTFARPGYFERALKAQVHGYLLKDGSIAELAMAIRNVMQGKRQFDPELMLNAYQEGNPLTEREQEILRLAAAGKTAKEVARQLFLSPGTVRNYLSDTFQKVGAKNKIEAIARAKEKGWI